MSLHDELTSLRRISTALPFTLDDSEQVNAAYARWRQQQSGVDRDLVSRWTYCFVRRYYLMKFMASAELPVVECDLLISLAEARIATADARLDSAARYASWVSVVCKNLFRNFLRDRRLFDSVEERHLPTENLDDASLDEAIVRESLAYALNRLPSYLREPVIQRLVYRKSYEQIAIEFDKPVPVLRSYVCKAIGRLRKDAALLRIVDVSM